ncbi:MAG: response regulator [Dehalococcoidales bacterium]|nr:response regulator [Dehalococcoidales bacterium]
MSGQQGSILIVDDEAAIRSLLHKKLSSEGYQCQEAGNADQAMDELRKNAVEVVILDIGMPGKSGVELLPEIKDGYPDAVVIMATATTDINTVIWCMKQGAYDYFTKPFILDDVVLGVDRALEKRRLRLEIKDYQEHLEQRVGEQAEKIRTSFLNAITALVYALEAKDKYASGHSQRVAQISVAIARELGVRKDSIEKIRVACLVHDIGKIGVRESTLNKPSGLTDEEYQHVQCHPEIGERILTAIVEDEEILKVVRHHHERYDGTGYPDRLSADQIPVGARILALADAYDAMTSQRPYRAPVNSETTYAEIERSKGTQFAPDVVDAFLRIKGITT